MTGVGSQMLLAGAVCVEQGKGEVNCWSSTYKGCHSPSLYHAAGCHAAVHPSCLPGNLAVVALVACNVLFQGQQIAACRDRQVVIDPQTQPLL